VLSQNFVATFVENGGNPTKVATKTRSQALDSTAKKVMKKSLNFFRFLAVFFPAVGI